MVHCVPFAVRESVFLVFFMNKIFSSVLNKYYWNIVSILFYFISSIDVFFLLRVKDMAADRHKKLDESNALHQFYRDVDDEESWIK